MTSNSIYATAFAKKKNDIDLTEYFDYIESKKLEKSEKFKTSNHHILPRWAFPEYSSLYKNPWNRAILLHEDHLVAHFVLWKCWRCRQNASPLLLMCGPGSKELNETYIQEYKYLFSGAVETHAKYVGEISRGRKSKPESIRKSMESRERNGNSSRGLVNVVRISDNLKMKVTKEEYRNNKGLYKSKKTNRPAWNKGRVEESLRGKVRVVDRESGKYILVASDEYRSNKSKYIHPMLGKQGEKGNVPVRNLLTNETMMVERKDFETDPNLTHVTAGRKFYNNGITNVRLLPDETIPEGYVRGRFFPIKANGKKKISTRSICPHCNLEGTGPNMKRYHFDKCKSVL